MDKCYQCGAEIEDQYCGEYSDPICENCIIDYKGTGVCPDCLDDLKRKHSEAPDAD